MDRRSGLTLIEVLVALAAIGIVFAALGAVQLQSVRATATASRLTLVKGEANRLLERLLAVTTANDGTVSSPDYAFSDYYPECLAPSGSPATGAVLPCSDLDGVDADDVPGFAPDPAIQSTWAIAGVPGATSYEKEGVMVLTVTASFGGATPRVTLGSAITCYDFFSGASAESPEPCPTPTVP